MIRRLILILAALAMTLGLGTAGAVLTAGAASASTPPCPGVYLWANPVVNHAPLFCYANETAREKAPYFYWS